MSDQRKRTQDPINLEGSKRTRSAKNLDTRIDALIAAVVNKDWIGQVIVYLNEHSDTSPMVPLQNAMNQCRLSLCVSARPYNHFQLKIKGEVFAEGKFPTRPEAKRTLAGETLAKLKKHCFFIDVSCDSEKVTKRDLLGVEEPGLQELLLWNLPGTSNRGGRRPYSTRSKARMLRLLSEKLDNFTRMQTLRPIVFEGFTRDDLWHINGLARSYQLKTRRQGSILTVSYKVEKMDLVKKLLQKGGQDGIYKVHIPTNFLHIWEGTNH